MPDVIRLLPDVVANQIAAGEVIQRPASALKELLENAVDSGASDIKVIIKDAGKTLIQVIDDGCGMSETDARLSFERHSTSKISDAKDLFAIRTMGFRGEALASIAAVAHVELKTKRVEDELATCIKIEGSKVIEQQPCAGPDGTSVSIKNLFYNVPARRNFLKSYNAETRHIIEEFQRIAIIRPEISFSLYHNNKTVFQLPDSNFKGRIVGIMGNNYNERLVPVTEETDLVKIDGFIGKPQYARKTRGEQYFFTNKRFIKHPYLHHSVENAYEELIPENAFPTYFINLEVDPAAIDVNIHPTKTEINFQNQQAIYAILKSAIKKALGSHSLTPMIDFDVEQSLQLDIPSSDRPVKQPTITVDPDYNPFDQGRSNGKGYKHVNKLSPAGWETLYDLKGTDPNPDLPPGSDEMSVQTSMENGDHEKEKIQTPDNIFQLHNRYIISAVRSGLLVIDQQLAHERILYDRFMEMMNVGGGASQQLLYPQTVKFSPQDAEILSGLEDELRSIGFEISGFGKNTFIVDGLPAGINEQDVTVLLERILENFKKNQSDLALDKKINFARSLSKNVSIKQGRKLRIEEMNNLIDELFACKVPDTSPEGKPTYVLIEHIELENRFKIKK